MRASSPRTLPAWLRGLLLTLALAFLFTPAQAVDGRGVSFRAQEIVPIDLLYVVNASLEMPPNARLEEIIESGVAIPFRLEFRLTRARWWWMDELVVERNMEFRLFYHALTRQYRLSIGSIHRSFRSLEEAMRALLTIRNWAVLDRSRLADGGIYTAALRFRLDMSQLPKPFQVVVFGNRDLDLSTGWVEWNFAASASDPR
ncbi:MAG: DUF4390 domain-containing protein [Candidatus Dactylopiibacterium sp.]|nr:DUF4390 domain-containing protein [Candidatus Dactylopiibacterium sp.]